jgi:hypothetical protein
MSKLGALTVVSSTVGKKKVSSRKYNSEKHAMTEFFGKDD